MFRFFSRGSEDESRTEDTLNVQYGKDTHTVSFIKGSITDSIITVLDLRKACQETLKIQDINTMKLVFSGKALKEDNKPLSTYGIKSGAKILCMATKVRPQQPAGSASLSGSSTPPTVTKKKVIPPLEKISMVQTYIGETMVPLITTFEQSPPANPEQRENEWKRLTETVLGKLLELDSVDVDGADGAEVRKRRKEAVKEMQQLLKRMDAAHGKSSQ